MQYQVSFPYNLFKSISVLILLTETGRSLHKHKEELLHCDSLENTVWLYEPLVVDRTMLRGSV